MTTQLWLYEHEDGRHLVTVPGAAILAGDPQWHRVGPVEVQGVDASKEPPNDLQTEALTDEQIEDAALNCGAWWDGDRWCIEDADFHPFIRTLIASTKKD